VRYLADEARRRGFFGEQAPEPAWTHERLDEIDAQRLAWIRGRTSGTKTGAEVEVGEQLPTRPIGPHTKSSFATEWRAFIFTVWGSSYHEGAENIEEAGRLGAMLRDLQAA